MKQHLLSFKHMYFMFLQQFYNLDGAMHLIQMKLILTQLSISVLNHQQLFYILLQCMILKFLTQLQSMKFSGSFLWLHLSETL